jgi:hypothetical protein
MHIEIKMLDFVTRFISPYIQDVNLALGVEFSIPGASLMFLFGFLVPYYTFKIYKSTIVPKELSHLPRVPIAAALKSLMTPGGFISENKVLEKALERWCAENGREKDSWRDMYLIWLYGISSNERQFGPNCMTTSLTESHI